MGGPMSIPTIGTKWTTSIDNKTFRVVGVVDGLAVSRYAADRRATVDTLDWWRENAIVIPDPPKIEAGYCIVWQDGGLGAPHVLPDGAWRYADDYTAALGVVEVIPDDHGGARLVPVDRDGRRIGGESDG